MATITEAHHITVLLRAIGDHGYTTPSEADIAHAISSLNERAAKTLQMGGVLPAEQIEPLAREIHQRAEARTAAWEADLDARADARDDREP